MLQTIREHAGERLGGSGMKDAIRDAHADYYLQLAIRGTRELQGADQLRWLQRLRVEVGNLRAALDWGASANRASAIEAASSLAPFWHMAGHQSEGRRWLESMLDRAPDLPRGPRGRAASWAGFFAVSQADYEVADRRTRVGVALARAG